MGLPCPWWGPSVCLRLQQDLLVAEAASSHIELECPEAGQIAADCALSL